MLRSATRFLSATIISFFLYSCGAQLDPSAADSVATVRRINGVELTIMFDDTKPVRVGDLLTISFTAAEPQDFTADGMLASMQRLDSRMVSFRVRAVESAVIKLSIATLVTGLNGEETEKEVTLSLKGQVDS